MLSPTDVIVMQKSSTIEEVCCIGMCITSVSPCKVTFYDMFFAINEELCYDVKKNMGDKKHA